MSFTRGEYRDFFERRGREGCAESAKEVKERKCKIKKIKNKINFSMSGPASQKLFFFGLSFAPSFLRPLRNLRALCVQKIPASSLQITSHPTAGATK
jgi:hypothetical protein